MIEVPAYGGTLTEGIIGTPRFINPVLASSDADRDLVSFHPFRTINTGQSRPID